MAFNTVETGFYPETDRLEDYVAHLTPSQIEIFDLRAKGLQKPEISKKLEKSPHTIRNLIAYAMDTDVTNVAEIVYFLIQTGRIDKAELSEGLDFEKYNLLSEQQKDVIGLATTPEYWGATIADMADHLHRPEWSLSQDFGDAYKTLGVRNMLRLRVFMFLKAERDAQLQGLPQAADVLPVVSPGIISTDELRDWGQRALTDMRANARRQKLAVARAG